MKILVTGATGFIGEHVINKLLSCNYEVVATSRTLENAKSKNWFSSVIFLPFDEQQFDDSINYYDYFLKPELCIHLGWSGLPNYKQDYHESVNLPLQVRFLKNLLANGLKNLSVAGTCLEYGLKEGICSESDHCEPIISYAKAKLALYNSLCEIQLKHPFTLKWLRLFYTYGEGQAPSSIYSQLIQAIKNDALSFDMSAGDQQRDFLPISEMANFIIKASIQNDICGIINICSGEPISVSEFVERILQQNNASLKLNKSVYSIPDYEPTNFWGDNSKILSISK